MSYYWGFDGNDTENWEAGDSVEDCIKQAKEFKPSYIFIGTLETYVPTISPEDVIEELQEAAYCEHGLDLAGDWLEDVEEKHIETLGKRLNDILSQWLKETSNNPTFGNIVDIEKYYL